jgi:hypothetical protein
LITFVDKSWQACNERINFAHDIVPVRVKDVMVGIWQADDVRCRYSGFECLRECFHPIAISRHRRCTGTDRDSPGLHAAAERLGWYGGGKSMMSFLRLRDVILPIHDASMQGLTDMDGGLNIAIPSHVSILSGASPAGQ